MFIHSIFFVIKKFYYLLRKMKKFRDKKNIINTDFINFYNFDNWLKIEKLILI